MIPQRKAINPASTAPVSPGFFILHETTGSVEIDSAWQEILGIPRDPAAQTAAFREAVPLPWPHIAALLGAFPDMTLNAAFFLPGSHRVIKAECRAWGTADTQPPSLAGRLSDMEPQRRLDRLRRHYFRSFAHDVRTPVSSVKESVALVLEGHTGDTSPVQKKCLGVAQGEILRINSMIDEALCLSGIPQNELLPPAAHDQSLNEHLKRILQIASPFLEKNKNTVTLDLAWRDFPFDPFWVIRRKAIPWIFTALLHHVDPGNAVRITAGENGTCQWMEAVLSSERLAVMKWEALIDASGRISPLYAPTKMLSPLLTAALRYLEDASTRMHLSREGAHGIRLRLDGPLAPVQQSLNAFLNRYLTCRSVGETTRLSAVRSSGDLENGALELNRQFRELATGKPCDWIQHPETGSILFFENPLTGPCQDEQPSEFEGVKESSLLSEIRKSGSVIPIDIPETPHELSAWLKRFVQSD